MKYNLNDKVRFLNEKLEGVIVRILDENNVEVEVDGFPQPAAVHELVLVQPVHSKTQAKVVSNPVSTKRASGFYMHFSHRFLQVYDASWLNLTGESVWIAFYQQTEKGWESRGYRVLLHGEESLVATLDLQESDRWGKYGASVLPLPNQNIHLPESYKLIFRFQAKDFAEPELEGSKKHYYISLHRKEQTPGIKQPIPPALPKDLVQMEKPSETVDLHLDKLVPDPEFYQSEQALNLQMETFINQLTKARSLQYHAITFIHGVGNGILKEKLRKYLSQQKDLSYREAQKEKFGYGAIEVLFRH